jgi:hypothetical protein
MNWTQAATILVSLVALASAYASQRAATRASVVNTASTNRVDMETEAYLRARAFDVETIKRQDAELEDLQVQNSDLRRQNSQLRADVRRLTTRVALCERDLTTTRQALSLVHPDEQ